MAGACIAYHRRFNGKKGSSVPMDVTRITYSARQTAGRGPCETLLTAEGCALPKSAGHSLPRHMEGDGRLAALSLCCTV